MLCIVGAIIQHTPTPKGLIVPSCTIDPDPYIDVAAMLFTSSRRQRSFNSLKNNFFLNAFFI